MTVDPAKLEILTNAPIEEPKSSLGAFTLPCGYLDFSGAAPVLHAGVVVDEINGAVEDMLSSENVPPHLKFGQLIAMCTSRVGPYVDPGEIAGRIMPALTIGDRAFLLLAARRVSLGDQHHFTELCANPKCLDPKTLQDREPKRSESLYTIDLSTIEIKPMPDPMTRSYSTTVKVKGAKVPVTFHPMTGADEEKIARYTDSKSSLSIIARLDTWDGKQVTLRPDGRNVKDLLALVQSLGIGTRNELRDAFASVEGGIDTTNELTCPLCGIEFQRELRIDTSFFRPSEVLDNWKRRSAS